MGTAKKQRMKDRDRLDMDSSNSTKPPPPGQKVGTVSVKRWQRNLHNRHYSLHFVCRSVACCSQTAPSSLSDVPGCLRQQTTIHRNNTIFKKKTHPYGDLCAKSCLTVEWEQQGRSECCRNSRRWFPFTPAVHTACNERIHVILL